MDDKRIIGRYDGQEKGPLLLCFAGMHGNEPAGVEALEILFKMLEIEPITNPDFRFRGRLLGLKGNVRALGEKDRYLEVDLNRIWTPENVARVKQTPRESLSAEFLELREMVELIETEAATYRPRRIVFLDLHTTSATGGIFSIATDDPESLRIAVELHAPVIKGMLQGLQGTTLHYFRKENLGVPTVGVVFEAGQHDDPLSVNRIIAAVTNCMRTIGCVRAEDVENRHDQLLIEFSRNLPKVSELILCHRINEDDNFRMRPNFHNFQPIRRGELLAHDRHGPIYAQTDGLILMPLYQRRGSDGFFLIRKAAENGNGHSRKKNGRH